MEIDISDHLFTTAFSAPVLIFTVIIAIVVFVGSLLATLVGAKSIKNKWLLGVLSSFVAAVMGVLTLFAGMALADHLNHSYGNRTLIRTSTLIEEAEKVSGRDIVDVKESDAHPSADPIVDTSVEEATVEVLVEGQVSKIEFSDENTAILIADSAS